MTTPPGGVQHVHAVAEQWLPVPDVLKQTSGEAPPEFRLIAANPLVCVRAS